MATAISRSPIKVSDAIACTTVVMGHEPIGTSPYAIRISVSSSSRCIKWK